MKPTFTITSRHLTLIFGILVGLIVLVLMMLRSPEANVASTSVFPSFELPSADAKILQIKFALAQAIEIIR
jgi:hypothetical protein